MSQVYISPYINFGGRCREAMEHYQQALGGTLDLLTFNEGGAPKPAGPGDPIMHARLSAGGATVMGSDGMVSQPPTPGNTISVTVFGDDEQQLRKAFDALAEGGNVMMPLKQESWGDTFGMLTDKFGINWMINIGPAGGSAS